MPRVHAPCDKNRPTAGFDQFELRGGQMIVGCKCTRNDGMQHECLRTKCMGRPPCLTFPVATCAPSQPCPLADNGGGGGGGGGSWTGAERPPVNRRPGAAADEDRDRSRAATAAARRLRRRAVDQYDDRPAFRALFEPCRVHARKPKADCRPPATDGATKRQ
ncbi:uncharacterized protein LOC112686558 [Sipha flava]|uniref:Uncharacterized protein LOC112686558 n=1 Tax=Sipha flava TaxID=143950 RepID=A0A8B8FV49_9HEMI|nr:uncharacterized protein LOC112686558 [Sipha flava]